MVIKLYTDGNPMKSLLKKILITTALCLMPLMAMAEFVFINDGSILKGSIVAEDAKTITLQTEDGKKQKISRDIIMRILYTKLNMGKIFVQKKNGKSFTAFMVDEDQDTYTFRNDLYKPEEFKVKREDVLFLAERTPSGLEGEAGTDSITLIWYPPYDKMEKYNIYVKMKPEEQYKLYDTTGTNSYTMENLPGNTRYFIRVTGIDARNEETPPGNELEITTLNSPPSEPESLVQEKQPDGSLNLKWNAATDRDGIIIKYVIFTMEDDKRKVLAETPETNYKLAAGASFKGLYILAVDNNGAESDDVRFPRMEKEFISLSFYPGMFMPLGHLGEMLGPAFGASLNLTYNGLMYNALEAGIETGCFYMLGKDSMDKANQESKMGLFAPLYIYAGWKFYLDDDMSLTPYITCGAAFLYMDYTSRDWYSYEVSSKTMQDYGPAANLGLAFTYRLSDANYATIRTSFGYMPMSGGGMLLSLDMGIMYRL